nr:MAG: DNA pilot protein [Microvirus sp.]
MFGLDPASATLGAGALGFVGGLLTNEANKDIASSNNEWSAEQYAKRYQTQVADLKAAGLNPMLAYNQSPGTAPSAQQVIFQNPMSSAMDAVRSSSGAAQSHSSAHQADAQVKLIDANVDKVKEETKNLPLEGRRLERLSALLAEQLNVAFQETQSKIKAREVMQATINKLDNETGLLKNQLAVEQSLQNLGRTTKELAPAVSVLLDIIRASRK